MRFKTSRPLGNRFSGMEDKGYEIYSQLSPSEYDKYFGNKTVVFLAHTDDKQKALTKINWTLYKWFKPYEFKCPCCGLFNMSEDVLVVLQAARESLGEAIIPTSGTRCQSYNRLKGSKDTSSHIIGEAVDIEIPSSNYLSRLIIILVDLGVKRIGFYKNRNFIHIDLDKNKPDAIWVK